MKELLKKILNEMISLNHSDSYDDALYDLFCGLSKSTFYKPFIDKWFVEPYEIFSKTSDCENVEFKKITDEEFQVVTFLNGYDGYVFTFIVKDGKLKISMLDDITDNYFETVDYEYVLTDDEVNNILN